MSTKPGPPPFNKETSVGVVWKSDGQHHIHWDAALTKAVKNADPIIYRNDGRWITVRLFVHMRKKSPGWVDGYRVELGP